MGESGIERLPEGCIAHAISLTSPREACCSCAVSTAFRSAAASDTVWSRFLPDDLDSLLARAVDPVQCSSSSSKRDLFFSLCNPILIDGGKMSFSLDRSTGAKCYMLSARELFVVWGDTPCYWRWYSLPESRFSEVAELIDVCWLEVRGKIETKMLSQNTFYAAYLVFKLSDRCSGLGYPPQEASVKLGVFSLINRVCLQPSDMQAHLHARRNRGRGRFGRYERWRSVFAHPEAKEAEDDAKEFGGVYPRERTDGWMEVQLGQFYNDKGEDGEVSMSFLEVKGGHWKHGLIIEGIEIRPKN
ncbi:F-box protein PP2-B12 [Canna indica]|uniref:F-box protein PP2-B12 n=1 Tax=Canna indica TaxID=4628 RepID=A0AAQ3L398_9LILI|nr:F-box protein PP2-B12 [Canna indica]